MGSSVFLEALRAHNVRAFVSDVHHHRVHGGLSVETDYLVTVAPRTTRDPKKPHVTPFGLSKTYHAFRTFVKQLKHAADGFTSSKAHQDLPDDATHAARTCEILYYLIESQHTEYLGKINFSYVKTLANQRQELINNLLEALTERFLTAPNTTPRHALVEKVANLIDLFFLTDHCALPSPMEDEMETGEEDFDAMKSGGKSSVKSFVVVPISERNYLTPEERKRIEEDLHKESSMEDVLMAEATTAVSPLERDRNSIGEMLGSNPLATLGGLAAGLAILRPILNLKIRLDADVSIFFMVVAFVLGRQSTISTASEVGHEEEETKLDHSGRRLLRHTMASSRRMMGEPSTQASTKRLSIRQSIDQGHVPLVATMPKFPKGAKLGSVTHCWSESNPTDFLVRGPNYKKDHKKVESGDFLFPCRGSDLFLTDSCPENVGRNNAVLDGKLRDVPTFIINFRLPWGILVLYYEIPEFFTPFLQAGYERDFDKSKLPSLRDMTPGQRTACRFLQADDATKNKSLKIIPIVVDGPWIVRQVVGGKPSILGKKVPIKYVYQPPVGGKAMYLEADLDIAASSAARSILSVVRTYTNALTLDMGFVVQSNESDEFPEQMLVGCRMHGVDPIKAPGYPASASELFMERQDSNVSSFSP
mmetsp:Transcript_7897/g.15304  ORF Transcript_7897/g.15304 Transcript_7897/m.15304 type:complete len:647 (-) Transcript_7897:125-2065(-)|eukprot:scaffold6899_cov183-Amphora_coffeaeformis.AAC.43